MDAEALQFPDSSFDAVTCRLGLMIFPHPDRALREMHRVLVKGGKAILVVWGTEEKVRLIQLFREVTAKHFPQANVPGAPLPFAFGIPEALEKALKEAGFVQIHTEPFTVTPSFAEAEELWKAFRDGTPLKALLAQATPEVVEQVHNSVVAAVESFRNSNSGQIELSSEALFAAGDK
jgi:SAM-dependent methyltransferase